MLDFNALCLPNRASLLAFAINLTKNRADAEDLVQETLSRAFQAWAEFSVPDGRDPVACVRGWLFCVLRNRFNTRWRDNRARIQALREAASEAVEGTYGRGEIEPEDREPAWIAIQYSDEVLGALSALDAGQREVIVRHAAGQQYSQIAEELGIPIGTVMSRLYRGRRLLAAALAEFAAARYGMRDRSSARARVHVVRVQAAQSPQPEADSVDAVVVGDDDGEFVGAEGELDAVAPW